VVIGHQLPTRIRLTFADWAPVEVTAEADRWNIWQLLAAVVPAEGPEPGADYWGFGIEATLPDGSILPMQVRHDELRLGGRRYQIPFYEGLNGVIHRLRFSEEALKNAVSVASSVRVAIVDLPGVERELTTAERERLHQSLTGAIPVISAAGPQPLEAPFPQYGIHLAGKEWKGTLLLSADRYIRAGFDGSALHTGELARLVKGSLPVPQQKPSDVGYLYLADTLEIGQGNDLTRWKNTVVRGLTNARVLPGYQPSIGEPFTLTFRVKGESFAVQVDADGFTYAGKRYPGSGLTEMIHLQGVP
jgi:hypothetical protein